MKEKKKKRRGVRRITMQINARFKEFLEKKRGDFRLRSRTAVVELWIEEKMEADQAERKRESNELS